MPLDDRDYLCHEQYKDAGNLNSRATLHERFGNNPVPWQRWVFDHATTHAPLQAAVLEVGCGPARLWAANLNRVPPGWRVTLTDFSPGMVASASDAIAALATQSGCRVADVQSLPFHTASFDLAIANHMLYHVPDRARAIYELARVLKPGGLLLAATNGAGHMRQLRELARALGIGNWDAAATSGFRLDNGVEQLRDAFADVTLLSYENTLRITEAGPLVEYLLSTAPDRSEVVRTRATRFIQNQLTQHGTIDVVNETGLFVCTR